MYSGDRFCFCVKVLKVVSFSAFHRQKPAPSGSNVVAVLTTSKSCRSSIDKIKNTTSSTSTSLRTQHNIKMRTAAWNGNGNVACTAGDQRTGEGTARTSTVGRTLNEWLTPPLAQIRPSASVHSPRKCRPISSDGRALHVPMACYAQWYHVRRVRD